MLLTISTTHRPATDLGYLLRKNPGRAQSIELSFGRAHVFYPEADDVRCTVALMIEVDPVGLVRNRRGPSGEGGQLDRYVNDRPYAASSFLSVAMADVFGSALSGQCKERPELASCPIPLSVSISALPCRGGEVFLRRLFEPLGYGVEATRLPLDTQFSEWGDSSYYRVELTVTLPLHQLLRHLYVLVPVLDNDKHYWVGDDEVAKLLRRGEGWLAGHPERESITRRYLKHQRSLITDALAQLADESDPDMDATAEVENQEEEAVERTLSLNEQRLGTVLAVLKSSGSESVVDLGCGEGRLLSRLLKERQFSRILGMDVSHRAIERAADHLHWDRLPALQKQRLELLQGSLMYRDERLSGFDAAALVEVIEHMDPPRLSVLERVVFECAKPKVVVVTTPNREYNVVWESLPDGAFRHRDHRFEWTRTEFEAWGRGIGERFGYRVRFLPVGPEDPRLGPPTQLALFEIGTQEGVPMSKKAAA
jgi:3' terminal RNA ribose 2'-O-methyltransferase Hen1